MAPSDEPARTPCLAHDVPPDGERVRQLVPRYGMLPVALVAGLAFLLASFPARNNDLWMHLAAGRDLIHWQPFSGTLPPLSPTWLSDLLLFALFSTIGGPGLVFLKALLVVGLALILLRLSRAEQGWWIAVVS